MTTCRFQNCDPPLELQMVKPEAENDVDEDLAGCRHYPADRLRRPTG